MLDQLLFLESPIQIAMVLVIALIVFGPKRLPEIGKQIGSALREIRKATGDISRSFTTDYDPEPDTYSHNPTTDYNPGGYTRPRSIEAPLDLTDYTLAGTVPVAPTPGPSADLYDAYRIAPSGNGSNGAERPADGAAATAADAGGRGEGGGSNG